jgi:hypothetical protein
MGSLVKVGHVENLGANRIERSGWAIIFEEILAIFISINDLI